MNGFEQIQENIIAGSAFSARPWLSYPTYIKLLNLSWIKKMSTFEEYEAWYVKFVQFLLKIGVPIQDSVFGVMRTLYLYFFSGLSVTILRGR